VEERKDAGGGVEVQVKIKDREAKTTQCIDGEGELGGEELIDA